MKAALLLASSLGPSCSFRSHMNENPVHAKGVTKALGPTAAGWSPAVKRQQASLWRPKLQSSLQTSGQGPWSPRDMVSADFPLREAPPRLSSSGPCGRCPRGLAHTLPQPLGAVPQQGQDSSRSRSRLRRAWPLGGTTPKLKGHSRVLCVTHVLVHREERAAQRTSCELPGAGKSWGVGQRPTSTQKPVLPMERPQPMASCVSVCEGTMTITCLDSPQTSLDDL